MLSIEQCRKSFVCDGKALSNNEIEEVRTLLYQLASVLVDDFVENKGVENGNTKASSSE